MTTQSIIPTAVQAEIDTLTAEISVLQKRADEIADRGFSRGNAAGNNLSTVGTIQRINLRIGNKTDRINFLYWLYSGDVDPADSPVTPLDPSDPGGDTDETPLDPSDPVTPTTATIYGWIAPTNDRVLHIPDLAARTTGDMLEISTGADEGYAVFAQLASLDDFTMVTQGGINVLGSITKGPLTFIESDHETYEYWITNMPLRDSRTFMFVFTR